jgi:hypothetical protein
MTSREGRMPNNEEWMVDLKKVIFEAKYAILGFVQEEIPAQEFPDLQALQDLTSLYMELRDCLECDNPYGDTFRSGNYEVNYGILKAMTLVSNFSRLHPNHNITTELNDVFADLEEKHPKMFTYVRGK